MLFGRYINKYYKKYFWYFFFGFVALILVDILQLFVPQLVSEIIGKLNALIYPGDVPLGSPVWGDNVNLYGINDYAYYFINFGLIVISMGVLRFIWRITLNNAQVRIERDLRRELFYHVETLSLSFFQKQKTGGLMAYFTNDIEAVSYVFSDGINFLCDVVFLGTIAFIRMMLVNWLLGIICALPMIIFACIGYYVEKGQSTKFERRQEKFEHMSDFVQENLSGITVIKAFVMEASEMRKFARLNKENKMADFDYQKYCCKVDVLINACVYVSIFSLFIIGGAMIIYPDVFSVIPGTKPLIAENLIAFYGYYETLIWPMIAIGMLVNITSRGYASLRRISSILDVESEIRDGDYKADESFKGDIKFVHLDFKYPDEQTDKKALENLSFTIKKGERVGIIGKTGSGKTTLVNSLLKLYNIDRGMLFIDGVDINDWNARDLRNHIGYVAQDTFLFSDYIDRNISFAGNNYSQDQIERAASFACIDSNIKDFKDGYKTVVGERGATLSGGQKQRISISRAVIKDPDILILDDSVSALDADTEKNILDNIKIQRKGKTTFVIAHRISAVENLDKIIVIDNGKIVGFGTHEELMTSCELYQNISKLQSLQSKKENEQNNFSFEAVKN